MASSRVMSGSSPMAGHDFLHCLVSAAYQIHRHQSEDQLCRSLAACLKRFLLLVHGIIKGDVG